MGRTDRALVLVGPRQVGKTTILRQVAREVLAHAPPGNVTYFDFDDHRLETEVDPDWITGVRPPGFDPTRPRYFFFDEVTRYTRWDRWLKQVVDRARHGYGSLDRYVVTDSAASLLGAGRVESGLMRWTEIDVAPLTFSEYLAVRVDPGLDPEEALRIRPAEVSRYLAVGGFPAHALSQEDDLDALHATMRKDIVDVAIYRDLARHGVDVDRARRLFAYLAEHSGRELEIRKRASDMDTDPRAVEKWVQLLSDARLLALLENHSPSSKARSRLARTVKAYAGDHGLAAAFRTHRPEAAAGGELLETAVLRHLREATSASQDLGYFRTKDGLECDFVVRDPARTIAIEVTRAHGVTTEKRRTLRAVRTALHAQRTLLIHMGIQETQTDEIHAIPYDRFLLDPARYLEGTRA